MIARHLPSRPEGCEVHVTKKTGTYSSQTLLKSKHGIKKTTFSAPCLSFWKSLQTKRSIPSGKPYITGWNIPIFNRKYIHSFRGPHFPATNRADRWTPGGLPALRIRTACFLATELKAFQEQRNQPQRSQRQILPRSLEDHPNMGTHVNPSVLGVISPIYSGV